MRDGFGGRLPRRLWWGVVVIALAAVGPSAGDAWAGQMGSWTLRAASGATAQTHAAFAPVAGPLLHLLSQDKSTAVAKCEVAEVSVPYRVSWWLYVAGDMYDDFTAYQASDEAGQPTDVTIMLREKWEKLPPSPDDWHGIVWVQDAKGLASVAMVRRPGWHLVEVIRGSAREVTVKINREVIGAYQARSGKPARKIEVGDASATEGAGELYWAKLSVACGEAAASKQVAPSPWVPAATGAGVAECRDGFGQVQTVNLYLHNQPGKEPSKCEAEWGRVQVEIPYQFWCQVYVSEERYHAFRVVFPLTGDGKPTDIEVEFDDGEDGVGSAEAASVWVVDANGRHAAGSVRRGVWHELAIRRRNPREVDLVIDWTAAQTFAPRSPEPVARYRFGNFEADRQRGEAYWYRIRLVPIPKE